MFYEVRKKKSKFIPYKRLEMGEGGEHDLKFTLYNVGTCYFL